MAIGTGHRSNNYSESKRNDHLDNNRRQEQRNKGIPNKSHPNFREEHKSFSSIFVSNIPWNASVQDLWDICNKWGVVIDVYIAAKRSKSGHRFGFVRFINVNDINQLVSNLRTAWMGGFHLFADVAKYGRTYNRPVERSGDGKPSVGSNSQSVSINENVFQSFNSYAKAVLGNKSVDMSGKYGTSNAGAESVGVSDCNKVYKEAGNEAVMSISVDDCIDLDGMERSILAKVKDLSVISELLKHMSSEGFDDVGLRYVGGRWVWLEFDSMDQVESVKTSKALKEIFLEFKDVSHDFIPDERCVWIDLVGLPLASWAPEVYKKLGGRWGSSVFTDMVSDGPMSHGKVCVLTESLHRVIESFIVSYRNRTYRIIATEFAYWAPNIESMEVNSESNPLERKDAEGPSLDESLENEEHLDVDSCDSDSPKNVNNDSVSPSSRVLREEDVRGVESDLVDSFEEGEIRDDSVLYNDGCIKDCMEKNLEDSILAKVKDLSVISELLKHMSSEGFDDVGLRYVGGRWVWLEFDSMDQVESVKTSKALKEIFLEFKDVSHDFIPDERCVWIDLVGLPLASWDPEVYKKLGGRWGSSVFTDMVSDGPMSHGKVCVLTESLHRVIESFIVSYRNRTYRIIATEFAYWAPNIESMEVNSESNPLERKDAEGPSLDESLENEEHLDVDSCDSDSPKNVNNDSVSPSSRVLREEDVRGVESDLVDSFEEGEIRDDSVLYNDGCIKDCMEKNLEDDAGEILGVHSQGDCGNVTTDDNEDVTPVIVPEKDSIIAPPSTPPGNDLNIAAESGSWWIDYIGPLTSDEIDSDKRWSYRDPNGNIHGLFSLAQLRSWKDYFPSDLQIWSYYDNVKEAILLHNALSRQTKDAG
ncbi:RNA-directed DNA polymerase, eukaryota [Tanacetum coccineum]